MLEGNQCDTVGQSQFFTFHSGKKTIEKRRVIVWAQREQVISTEHGTKGTTVVNSLFLSPDNNFRT